MSLYSITDCSERALVKTAYCLKNGKKLARIRNHLTFLVRCREHKIIPNCLKVKLPPKTPNRKKLALITQRTGKALLRRLISDTRKKVQIKSEVNTYSENLRRAVKDQKWSLIESWCLTSVERTSHLTKETQKQKFELLWNRRLDNGVVTRTVVNRLWAGLYGSIEL